MDQRLARAGQLQDGLGQRNHGELDGVAEVHRPGQVVGAVHQLDKALDQIVERTEGARLRAIAVEGDGFVLQRLNAEVRDHATIVGVHARPVGVEDAGDLEAHAVPAAVVEKERRGAAFVLIVAGTQTDRVNVAPILPCGWMAESQYISLLDTWKILTLLCLACPDILTANGPKG